MKLVFNAAEVAASLGKTEAEFQAVRIELERLGFPKAIHGLEDKWSIMNVINWVNNGQETQTKAA